MACCCPGEIAPVFVIACMAASIVALIMAVVLSVFVPAAVVSVQPLLKSLLARAMIKRAPVSEGPSQSYDSLKSTTLADELGLRAMSVYSPIITLFVASAVCAGSVTFGARS